MIDLPGGGGGGEGLYAVSKGGGSAVQENSGGAGPAGNPPKPEQAKACTPVFEQWKVVTLKNGTKIPLVKETKFCAEADSYVEAQKLADAQAKNFLDKIEKEKKARTDRTYYGGACFSGDTYLKTQDGRVITFDELASLQASGEVLPTVASFDASTQNLLFQQPALLIEHTLVESGLIYLNLSNRTGESMILKVTPEHPMLTKREGLEKWVKAGALQDGEILVGGDGKEFKVDLASTNIVRGVQTVYNLSFSSGETGMVPTYLVSGDAKSWIVVHNKILQ